MSFWWHGGRRSGRSPARRLSQLLESHYGVAEIALGTAAVVLVVWLLWPEGSGPELDNRIAWQQSVEDAERRRVQLEAEEARGTGTDLRDATTLTSSKADAEGTSPQTAERPRDAEPKRRRIATPSELGDRLDKFGRRPGELAANQSIQPSPRRPAASIQPAIDADLMLQADAASETEPEMLDRSANAVRAALGKVIDNLRADKAAPVEPAPAEPAIASDLADTDGDSDAGNADVGDPTFDLAGLSSERLETEPLPKVDLSDLDTLVPEVETEPAPELQLDAALPGDAASASPAGEENVPFSLEPSSGTPATDVRERPRDDAPTWLKNAVASAVPDERPIIAVVIDDLGLNRPKTAALNDLPAPLTLAFLPYAGRIEAQTDAAHAAGHELMLHLPMEPVGSDWPGPDALTTKTDQGEFIARLKKNLDRFDGFVGINNHMGSKLTTDDKRMEVVMRELRKRDVLFLDSKTSARSVAGKIAGKNGVPNTERDVFLDHVIGLGAIKRQLALTETIARRNGSAVAIGHPHGATIEALREWLPSLEAKGFALAPISAVVARRACRDGVLIAADTCGRYLQARSPARIDAVAKGG